MSVRILNLPRTFFQRPTGTLRLLAFCTQGGFGGGLHVDEGGVANLDGCNVFSNEAYVRRLMPLPGPFPPAPRWNVSCARFLHAGWRWDLHQI